MAISSSKDKLLFIAFFYPYLMVDISEVQLDELFSLF